MAAATNLVHIQANEELVMRLKILAAKRNKKMYELVDEALKEWLLKNIDEITAIGKLMTEGTKESRARNKAKSKK